MLIANLRLIDLNLLCEQVDDVVAIKYPNLGQDGVPIAEWLEISGEGGMLIGVGGVFSSNWFCLVCF